MPGWLILAAVATILVTALLTWALWRINAPPSVSDRGEGSG